MTVVIIPAEGINSLIEPRERQALTLFPERSRKVDVIEKRIGEEEREEKWREWNIRGTRARWSL